MKSENNVIKTNEGASHDKLITSIEGVPSISGDDTTIINEEITKDLIDFNNIETQKALTISCEKLITLNQNRTENKNKRKTNSNHDFINSSKKVTKAKEV